MILAHQAQLEKPKYELADIFNLYIANYTSRHKLSFRQQKAVDNIQNCRTGLLGGHLYACDQCDYYEISNNSCGDRHCPKCQYVLKIKWVNARLKELLPVPYYHVVFTLPHFFNDLVLYNKKPLYDLLFKCASQVLDTFARDQKYLGAKPGYIGILHTWGQTLCQHVHLHFIVSGGGINADGDWVSLPHGSKFLFPVRALSKMFRGKFISKLKRLYRKGSLVIPDTLSCLKEIHVLDHYLNSVSSKKWRVYAKKPFAGPEEVVRYIGRYTHRIAISNYRILSIENGVIRFRYKDYKDNSKIKIMSLKADEFIRRFLLHILPKGYKKVRFFGFWSNGSKKKELSALQELIGMEVSSESRDEQVTIREESKCPQCGKGHLKIVGTISPEEVRPVHYANTS